jgi:hypothetical protein
MQIYLFESKDGVLLELPFASAAAPRIGEEIMHDGKLWTRIPSFVIGKGTMERKSKYPYVSSALPPTVTGCKFVRSKSGRMKPVIESERHEREVAARHNLTKDAACWGGVEPRGWAVVGGGPSAPRIKEILPGLIGTAAAGESINLFDPDYYFIVEEGDFIVRGEFPKVARDKAEALLKARDRGTKVLIDSRLIHVMKRAYATGVWERGFQYPYDDVIHVVGEGPNPSKAWYVWQRGMYVSSTSGVLALQHVVRGSPGHVHLLGMEGYGGEIDYFHDRRPGTDSQVEFTRAFHGPLIRRIVENCRDTTFYVYGDLRYELLAENVVRVP